MTTITAAVPLRISLRIRRGIAALAASGCLLGPQAGFTQALSEVWVVDFYTHYGPFPASGYDWYYSTNGVGGGSVMPGYFQMMAAIRELTALQSVRCSGGAYRDVISHADVTSRWLAAETTFRAVKQTQSMFNRIFGAGNSPFQGGVHHIEYADGGKEQWFVTDPYFSAALNGAPIPGTLQYGSGRVQPHHTCG